MTLYSCTRQVIWSEIPESQESLWDSCVVWKPQAPLEGAVLTSDLTPLDLGEAFLEGWKKACLLGASADSSGVPFRPPFSLPSDLRIFPNRFTHQDPENPEAQDDSEEGSDNLASSPHPSQSLQELNQLLVRDVCRSAATHFPLLSPRSQFAFL